MSYMKALVLDIIEEYGRGTDEFDLAEKFDLPLDTVVDIIEQYYNRLDEAA